MAEPVDPRVPTPCGTWDSPITPALLVSGAAGIAECVPEPDGSVWWAESRPDEGGRTALMRHADGRTTEISPPEANVRTTVHEYGGGAWWAADGVAWYVEHADQRVRQIRPGEPPTVLSPEPDAPKALRYADFRPTPDGRWLIGVGERHLAGEGEPRNTVFALATDGSERLVTLVEGADFYASPRISPDGGQLAWIEWNHPNMPWDDTTLRAATLHAGTDGHADERADDEADAVIALADTRLVAGGSDAGIAVVQPEWSPDGTLHFLSDRDDAWQLYREGSDVALTESDGEIGGPPWVFGLSRYAFEPDGAVVCARFEGGVEFLDGHPGYTAFGTVRTAGEHLAFVAASWSSESAVVLDGREVRAARDLALDEAFLVPPERITFPTGPGRPAGSPGADETLAGGASADVAGAAGDRAGERAHALYFAPANPDHRPADGERPPLVVLVHGGPTSAARSQLNLARRFWTSRGFAVCDVNYRGSSGFGRAYRKKLDGQWGVADVEDCVAAARFLIERGDVDPARLIIRGGSAGGFTVLSALACHDTFTAGASLYGVADLEALAGDTHKFESRYLDSLIGPYPEAKPLYETRSPINHLDGLTAPMIVLQGSEDLVVPPNQSRMVVAALEARGVPVAYLEFEGEQHGFRKAETIVRAFEAELAFYGRVFGFTPAGPEVALEIRHLDPPVQGP